MARKQKVSKEKLRLHADPAKVRRVWSVKPATRVHEGARKERLEQLRKKEQSSGDL